ncbi:MAG: methyltransferase domain-containing protein [Candidatus Aminicenantes bacterium]|nr:methyltransferase domain-containing protein [Candidatus Aminicenantes bacterium]NIO82852.1 methyltransferase domain-containing protein [Candidatus Aminicenantes bacterium]NIT23498.1 methyltransferase domain-containing protein [Candidatus Aminicenantes bacterium]
MFQFENDYWWYRGLHELVLHYVENIRNTNAKTHNQQELKILDAGCGTGRMMELLAPYGKVEGIDYSEDAVNLCKNRGLENVRRDDLNTWAAPAEIYDVIISNDVIYNSGVEDDMAVVGKFHWALKPNGLLIMNLPAFKALQRKHDIAVFGIRRYRKKRTLRDLKKIGFSSVHTSYRLLPLFFIMLLQKYLLERFSKKKAESDLKLLPPAMNSFLLRLHRLENKIITRGIPLPLGSSLFLVCKKNSGATKDTKKHEDVF